MQKSTTPSTGSPTSIAAKTNSRGTGKRGRPKAAAYDRVRAAGTWVRPETAERLAKYPRGNARGIPIARILDEWASLCLDRDELMRVLRAKSDELAALQAATIQQAAEDRRTIMRQAAELARLGLRRRARSVARHAPQEPRPGTQAVLPPPCACGAVLDAEGAALGHKECLGCRLERIRQLEGCPA